MHYRKYTNVIFEMGKKIKENKVQCEKNVIESSKNEFFQMNQNIGLTFWQIINVSLQYISNLFPLFFL